MYTIGQVSELFHFPVSTLRYYDKQGLFPNLKRQSGIRQFDESDLEALRIIECLKASGWKSQTSNVTSSYASREILHMQNADNYLRTERKPSRKKSNG